MKYLGPEVILTHSSYIHKSHAPQQELVTAALPPLILYKHFTRCLSLLQPNYRQL